MERLDLQTLLSLRTRRKERSEHRRRAGALSEVLKKILRGRGAILIKATRCATRGAFLHWPLALVRNTVVGFPDGNGAAEGAMNEDVERFLEECRADAFFQNNPNGVDRIEDLLTKFYHEADESPAWQELWDLIRGIITGKAPLIERFEELLLLLKKTFG